MKNPIKQMELMLMTVLIVAAYATAQEQEANPDTSTGGSSNDIRLAVLEPIGKGLSKDDQWMLSLVQGSITGDFHKFSGMTIIDRQNLEQVLGEWSEHMSGKYSDKDYIKIGNLTNASHILTGNITKTAKSFIIEFAVTDLQSGVRKASYSPKPVSLLALEDLSAVKVATADILRQLGVELTSEMLGELKQTENLTKIQAETMLARGISAQKQGTEVAALSYFFQAATLDPSLTEAVSRSSIMAANVSSGNIGEDARNDIAWRKAWVKRLEETERYIDNLNKTVSMPYTLFYSDEIIQGDINYQNETMSIAIKTYLYGSSSIFLWKHSVERALQAVYDGLETTQRKKVWGLENWPYINVTDLNPFKKPQRVYTGLYGGRELETRYNKAFTIIVELVNSRNKVIGKQEFEVNGYWKYNVAKYEYGPQKYYVIRPYISLSTQQAILVNFTNVKAADITDKLTIRFANVNGEAAETAARKGILQIRAMSKGEFDANYRFKFEFGEIRDYGENKTTFVIPNTILDDQVISIGDNAFRDKGLTNITIPNSVISIGERAFYKNNLTNVILPNHLTSIGNEAFHENKLTNVILPYGLTSIGDKAFYDNELTSVTIPNSVISIGGSAFSGNILAKVILPNGITSIREGTFAYNKLTNITIPNSVTSIGWSAFERNVLTTVTLPDGLTTIGERAFLTNQLTSITIPNSVTSIGTYAFRENPLTNVTIGADVELFSDAFEPWDRPNNLYNDSGRRAGTFTVINGEWSYSPSR